MLADWYLHAVVQELSVMPFFLLNETLVVMNDTEKGLKL